MHDSELNLSTSSDGRIEEILERNDDFLRVMVRIPFHHDEQFQYFRDALERGNVFADFRVRAARLGIDLWLENPGNGAFIEDGKTLVYEAKIAPYMDEFLPSDGKWQDTLGYKGWNPGKLVALMPEHFVSVAEINEKMRSGNVRLPHGSEVTLEGVKLALNGGRYIAVPEKMRVIDLTDALDNLDREELALYQKKDPNHNGNLVVPANGGVLTHTCVRPNDYSLIMRHDQKEGVRSTQAMHVSPHSGTNLFIGLKGNGQTDVSIDSIIADFYDSPKIKLSSSVSVPELKLSDSRSPEGGFNPAYSIFVHAMGRQDSPGKIIKLDDYDSRDKEDVAKFGEQIDRRAGKNNIYYNYTFLAPELVEEFLPIRRAERTSAIIFSSPPIRGESFGEIDYNSILRLRRKGIEVIWDHPELGRLYFHRAGFMRPEERVIYDHAYSSNSNFSFFGSASKLSGRTEQDIDETMAAASKFVGGFGYAWNGGGPGVMAYSTGSTLEHGLRVATSSLQIAQEQQQKHQRHVVIPFGGRFINIRQKIMVSQSGGGFFIFEGGTGSYFEEFESMVKNTIEARNKPIILVGDSPIHEATMELIHRGIEAGTVTPNILNTVYHLKHGNQVYDTLIEHYNFQKA